MRRLIALTTVVAALGVGATTATAAAPTPYDQFQKLCERQGGLASVQTFWYDCFLPFGNFTTRDISQATKLCSRIGGVALLTPQPYVYDCILL